MTSWEDDLRTSVAEQMGLNRNSSMSIPNYSEDTFTSLSEGEQDDRQYENDSFESYYSVEELEQPAASDLTQTTWQSSRQNDEGDSLARKWINLLKDNRTRTERAKPPMEPDIALPGISEVPEEELGALRSFCARKISHLRHQRNSEPLKRSSHKDQRHRLASRKQLTGGCNFAVPWELVNRLHLKNIKEMAKKIAETEMHQPSQCPFCMKKRAEFAKVEFLRRKKTILDNVLLREKLEDYMYTKDSLTLIGEIHKSLPKLSEDPMNIWQELNKRGWKE
ncbi:uncharacterized protein C8orf48 homolog isoform X1 [Python bivittatus]|uniref:Uncharacterized protein C8orf48 homolog isoform X1 n=1 Tax=Python bivittatus TaxID=176946 RepID=A0A9F2R474_PYTBI|nr:uncharacterized protein C8orf48 homolog isoform X1 [Python bivittatus]XP_025026969.1 uncharacterized protein C8orf48 homolog isoform X1 [Python bivittatus]